MLESLNYSFRNPKNIIWVIYHIKQLVSASESGFREGKTVTRNLKCHQSPFFLIFSLYLSLIYIVSAHKFAPETPPSDSLIQFEINL